MCPVDTVSVQAAHLLEAGPQPLHRSTRHVPITAVVEADHGDVDTVGAPNGRVPLPDPAVLFW